MERELNIAAILKDKPKGTKLFDTLRGINVYLDSVGITLEHIYCTGDGCSHYYTNTGGFSDEYPNGMQILKPSKEMQDWSKFAWKKDDVLVNGCGFMCIFKEWVTADYTKFNGCYSNSRDGYEDVPNAETIKFNKVDHNTAYGYIREIEKKLGGIFNTSTLKIEKPQFKDGDIVHYTNKNWTYVFISRGNGAKSVYASLRCQEGVVDYNIDNICSNPTNLRPATEDEKQQLFSALEKDGKAWDAEKKQIVDLPKKCEFKAFDKVLVRDTKDEYWRPAFFASLDEDSINEYVYCLIGDPDGVFCKYCIPYNDQTAHLLGTTDDWKGGEE